MEKPFTEMAVYVSPSGHDCADGTSTQPVATLHRAAEIARHRPKDSADRVTVHVATGKYFFSEPLFLTEYKPLRSRRNKWLRHLHYDRYSYPFR